MATALRAIFLVPFCAFVFFLLAGVVLAAPVDDEGDSDANVDCPDQSFYFYEENGPKERDGKVNLYGKSCISLENKEIAARGSCVGPKSCRAYRCGDKPCEKLKIEDVQRAVTGEQPLQAPPVQLPPSRSGSLFDELIDPASTPEQTLEQKSAPAQSANSVGEVLKQSSTEIGFFGGVREKISNYFWPTPLNIKEESFQLKPSSGSEQPPTFQEQGLSDGITNPNSTFSTKPSDATEDISQSTCTSWWCRTKDAVSRTWTSSWFGSDTSIAGESVPSEIASPPQGAAPSQVAVDNASEGGESISPSTLGNDEYAPFQQTDIQYRTEAERALVLAYQEKNAAEAELVKSRAVDEKLNLSTPSVDLQRDQRRFDDVNKNIAQLETYITGEGTLSDEMKSSFENMQKGQGGASAWLDYAAQDWRSKREHTESIFSKAFSGDVKSAIDTPGAAVNWLVYGLAGELADAAKTVGEAIPGGEYIGFRDTPEGQAKALINPEAREQKVFESAVIAGTTVWLPTKIPGAGLADDVFRFESRSVLGQVDDATRVAARTENIVADASPAPQVAARTGEEVIADGSVSQRALPTVAEIDTQVTTIAREQRAVADSLTPEMPKAATIESPVSTPVQPTFVSSVDTISSAEVSAGKVIQDLKVAPTPEVAEISGSALKAEVARIETVTADIQKMVDEGSVRPTQASTLQQRIDAIDALVVQAREARDAVRTIASESSPAVQSIDDSIKNLNTIRDTFHQAKADLPPPNLPERVQLAFNEVKTTMTDWRDGILGRNVPEASAVPEKQYPYLAVDNTTKPTPIEQPTRVAENVRRPVAVGENVSPTILSEAPPRAEFDLRVGRNESAIKVPPAGAEPSNIIPFPRTEPKPLVDAGAPTPAQESQGFFANARERITNFFVGKSEVPRVLEPEIIPRPAPTSISGEVIEGRPPSVSTKAWDEPTLTREEFVTQYNAHYPNTALTEEQLATRFEVGQRLNPETGRLKVPDTVVTDEVVAGRAVAEQKSVWKQVGEYLGFGKTEPVPTRAAEPVPTRVSEPARVESPTLADVPETSPWEIATLNDTRVVQRVPAGSVKVADDVVPVLPEARPAVGNVIEPPTLADDAINNLRGPAEGFDLRPAIDAQRPVPPTGPRIVAAENPVLGETSAGFRSPWATSEPLFRPFSEWTKGGKVVAGGLVVLGGAVGYDQWTKWGSGGPPSGKVPPAGGGFDWSKYTQPINFGDLSYLNKANTPPYVPPVTRRDVVPTGSSDDYDETSSPRGLSSMSSVLGQMLARLFGASQTPQQPQAPRTTPIPPPIIPPSTATSTSPKPIATLIANPIKIALEGKARLTWSSIYTSDCELFAPDRFLMATGTRGSTSTLALATTTRFTLDCRASSGATTSAQATVTVQ